MKIFVSYPPEHSGYAQKLTQALTAQRHEVVSERLPPSTLPALNDAVCDAISAADLFLFVLAPESLVPGSATRLELRRAQRCWPEPAGHVLTVAVAPTPWHDIPRYLRQCTRVRAPGSSAVIPDAGVCAAAVAELEKKRGSIQPQPQPQPQLQRSAAGPANKRRSAPDSTAHSSIHPIVDSTPDSRPYGAPDSRIEGGHDVAAGLARPANSQSEQAQAMPWAPTQTKTSGRTILGAKTHDASAPAAPPLAMPSQGGPAMGPNPGAPALNAPSTGQEGISTPTHVGPAVSVPAADEPMLHEPASSDARLNEPNSREPAIAGLDLCVSPISVSPVIEPLISEPVISEPVISEPVINEPVIGESVLSGPLINPPVMDGLPVDEPAAIGPHRAAPAQQPHGQHPNGLAAAGSSPIVAHPAHAAGWAGQRSWRRGKSRGSSRSRSRKPRGLWGLVRRYGGLSLGVGCLAVVLLAALAWQWMRVAPTTTRAPARPSAETAETAETAARAALAELAIADPVARKVQRAQRLCQEGGFASASQQLAALAGERGAPAFVHHAREDCAMAWLRGAEVRRGESNFTQLVAPLRPLLAQAVAVAPSGPRMADLRAHLGWADYLTWIDSRSTKLDPMAAYQAALALDPGNAYAQAMGAVWTLVQGQGGAPVGADTPVAIAAGAAGGALPYADAGLAAAATQGTGPGPLALARQALAQIQAATASALVRRQAGDRDALAFVRRLQLGNLGSVPELAADHIRMLDDMRRGNEPREAQLLQLAWTHLYAPSYQEAAHARLQAALSAEDNLKTFLWCFPKAEPGAPHDADHAVWRLVHGMLLTQAGRGREARADLAALHAEVRMNQGATELTRAVDRLLAQRQ